jgi:hypothetical protein
MSSLSLQNSTLTARAISMVLIGMIYNELLDTSQSVNVISLLAVAL